MKPGWNRYRLAYALIICLGISSMLLAAWQTGWRTVIVTADQRGALLMALGEPEKAASAFQDPLLRGYASFRSGDFKAAAQAFAAVDTAKGNYNQATALVMLGKYDDAIARFDRALELQPGWQEAIDNRHIASIRALRLKTEGGEAAEEKSDDITFDKRKKGGLDTTITGEQPLSDEAVRALWLKRLETKPADFLRLRFSYQQYRQANTPPATSGEAAP